MSLAIPITRIWDTLAETNAKNNLSPEKLRIVIVGILQANSGNRLISICVGTHRVCLCWAWLKPLLWVTHKFKQEVLWKIKQRLSKEFTAFPVCLRSCSFHYRFIKWTKREHLTSVECFGFLLILPSTPLSNLGLSKMINFKHTLNKCFLIKNSSNFSAARWAMLL